MRHIRIRICLVVITAMIGLVLPAIALAQTPVHNGFWPWRHWGSASSAGSFTLYSAPSPFGGVAEVTGGGFTLRGDYVPFAPALQIAETDNTIWLPAVLK